MFTNNSRYDGTPEIRDQRLAPWFSVDHAIVFDWLPIIGQAGYALYSIYLSLAAQQRPSPGIRRLAAHIGCSEQSIKFSNRVLEWAGLIAITPGDRESSNIYDILDVPAVSDERIQQIIAAALASDVLQRDYAKYYTRRLLDACQHWRPIWQRQPGSILRATAAAAIQASATDPPPADLAGRLAAIGMAAGTAAELISKHAPLVDGWLTWMEAKIAADSNYFRNPAGYLLRVVANGDHAPEPPAVEPEHLCSLCQKRPVTQDGELCQNCQEKYADFVRR